MFLAYRDGFSTFLGTPHDTAQHGSVRGFSTFLGTPHDTSQHGSVRGLRNFQYLLLADERKAGGIVQNTKDIE